MRSAKYMSERRRPPKGGEGWEQDPDTLDTWFSSGLWPFSTLGWPDKTKDLETYFPNSFMAPGYEILPLWVARMILMSGVLMENIPFQNVLIHGIVRDAKAQKFSKSQGNGIDPLILADNYGADALRMALIDRCRAGQRREVRRTAREGLPQFLHEDLEHRTVHRDEQAGELRHRWRGKTYPGAKR